jgi:hypothetical protein
VPGRGVRQITSPELVRDIGSETVSVRQHTARRALLAHRRCPPRSGGLPHDDGDQATSDGELSSTVPVPPRRQTGYQFRTGRQFLIRTDARGSVVDSAGQLTQHRPIITVHSPARLLLTENHRDISVQSGGDAQQRRQPHAQVTLGLRIVATDRPEASARPSWVIPDPRKILMRSPVV